MKIAHIGDMHWGLNYPGPTPESRFEDITRVMDWCADRIIEERCELVLVAGDMFKDARVFLDRASREIKVAAAWLRKLADEYIEVYVISGTPSHDAISAYDLLQEMNIPRVSIQTTPATMWFGDINVAFLPGMNRSTLVAQEEYRSLPAHAIHQVMTERITKTCQDMLGTARDRFNNCPTILLGHLTYDLADKGFEDVLMQHEPVLTPEAIQGYDLVCLGHIHRPQQNGNVLYCGSPERLSFNDENIFPGFWIHSLENREFTSEFIKTPARRYHTQDWDERDVLLYLDGNKLSSIAFADAVVRLHYTCSEAIAKRLDKKRLEEDLYAAGAFYVTEIIGKVTESHRNREEEVTAEMGPVEALKKWCEQPEIAIDEVEIPFLLDMTKSLLEGVSV